MSSKLFFLFFFMYRKGNFRLRIWFYVHLKTRSPCLSPVHQLNRNVEKAVAVVHHVAAVPRLEVDLGEGEDLVRVVDDDHLRVALKETVHN